MRFITPNEIEQVAWEGRLEPLAETFKGSGALPHVTLGEPVWWPAEQAMETEAGKKWTPPAGGRRYTLLRLACSLHPPSEARSHYTEAALTAYLRPARGGSGPVVAHDLLPRQRTVEETGTLKIGLGPDLKFGPLDISLLELGAEIEYPQVYPVIQGYGLGESRAYWQFQAHSAHPLLGCQSVYAVLDAPGEAGGVRLSIELVAQVQTRWGIIFGGLPEAARAHLSRLINA